MRLGDRPDALASWAERERMFPRWLAPALAPLAMLWVGATAYAQYCLLQWLIAGGAIPADSLRSALLMSIVNLGVSITLRRRARNLPSVEEAAEDLSVLAEVLQVLEQETFASARLRSLRASLDSGDLTPSAAVKKLKMDRLLVRGTPKSAGSNVFPIHFLQRRIGHVGGTLAAEVRLCDSRLALYRGRVRGTIRAHLYASETPADVLPEFVEQRACFEATGLAHPLLPASTAAGDRGQRPDVRQQNAADRDQRSEHGR